MRSPHLHHVAAVLCVLTGFAMSTALVSAGELSEQERIIGFVSLFDGKTLNGWTGATKGYKAVGGKIVVDKNTGGNLFTVKEYSDFILRFEFKLTPGANNGLGIRAPLDSKNHKLSIAYVGMELQILDNTAARYAHLKPYQYHGSLYGMSPARRGFLKPVGQWNREEVILNGSRVTVVLNGTVILDADIHKASTPGTLDGRPHPGAKRTRGHIGFLGHGTHVEFRNIRVKDLSGDKGSFDFACALRRYRRIQSDLLLRAEPRPIPGLKPAPIPPHPPAARHGKAKKKPTAKKPAAKRPAAKKPAVKKPAAKKPARRPGKKKTAAVHQAAPVVFRNATRTTRTAETGFVSLFDGKTLKGWVGATKGYKVEDGRIVCIKSKGGNLYTAKQYSDFDFRFEFKLTPGANNGLGIRAPLKGDAAYVGMELQILDNTAPRYARLKPYQYHGSIYGVVPAKRGFLKPVGQWNRERVIANGRHITVILNGHTIVDADIDKASKPQTMDHRPHPGLKRNKGHIGFLGHGAEVAFRHIRIKGLSRK